MNAYAELTVEELTQGWEHYCRRLAALDADMVVMTFESDSDELRSCRIKRSRATERLRSIETQLDERF